ncbi:MAG: hypothetical protein DMF00_05800, partial [Verrucomicrobia bacterium]
TPANFTGPSAPTTDPAWSIKISPASKGICLRVRHMNWEAIKIILFRIPDQKACGMELSNLL